MKNNLCNNEWTALVIDDEAPLRRFICGVLEQDGWQTYEADSAASAFEMMHQQPWQIVFSDVWLGPTKDGFDVLHRFISECPGTRVIMITAHGAALDACQAVADGAYDYLLKPFGITELQSCARSVRERVKAATPANLSPADKARTLVPLADRPMLIGGSAAIVEASKKIGFLAQKGSEHPVFVSGETGTGKEVVARLVHERSSRASKPFVAVNCGALTPELIESELFGHHRGAFTGAVNTRRGLWEEASGGTLFLDEITETPATFQVKILRAVEEGQIRPVGSNRNIDVDVRVIVASNRQVDVEITAGRFRADLYYRLSTHTIQLPPLRERIDDLPLLVEFFTARKIGRRGVEFTDEALRLMRAYDWPGNVRQLENAVIDALTISDGEIVCAADLPEYVRRAVHLKIANSDFADDEQAVLTLAEVERRAILRALEASGGNREKAARALDIDVSTLRRKLKDFKESATVPVLDQLPL